MPMGLLLTRRLTLVLPQLLHFRLCFPLCLVIWDTGLLCFNGNIFDLNEVRFGAMRNRDEIFDMALLEGTLFC